MQFASPVTAFVPASHYTGQGGRVHLDGSSGGKEALAGGRNMVFRTPLGYGSAQEQGGFSLQ